MNWYFMENDSSCHSTITNVAVSENKNQFNVEITTHRPGMLIGKGGTFIDGLKKLLTAELNKEVIIDIKENKMWSKLY
jgi:small subunit ribosomal protein S3